MIHRSEPASLRLSDSYGLLALNASVFVCNNLSFFAEVKLAQSRGTDGAWVVPGEGYPAAITRMRNKQGAR